MFGVGGPIEQVTELVSVDVSTVAPEDLFESMVAVAGLRSQLEHFLARAMAELDETGAMDDRKALTSASWLAREAQLPRSLTARWAKTGAQLRRRFELIDEAVADGRLSSAQAQFVVGLANSRIADDLADLQPEIIDLAEGASHEVFCADVRVLADTLDEDGGHDPADDVDRNRLKLAKLMNGLVKVDLELVGEQALLFEHGVNQRADELFHQYKTDAELSSGAIKIPSRTTLMALAVIDLVRRGQAVDEHSSIPAKPEVTLVARAEEPNRFCDGHGHTLPDGSIVTVCCDPDIWSVIANSFGVPLDLGRKKRRASAAQRKAMALRNGGCIFPGCSAPRTTCGSGPCSRAARTSPTWRACADGTMASLTATAGSSVPPTTAGSTGPHPTANRSGANATADNAPAHPHRTHHPSSTPPETDPRATPEHRCTAALCGGHRRVLAASARLQPSWAES